MPGRLASPRQSRSENSVRAGHADIVDHGGSPGIAAADNFERVPAGGCDANGDCAIGDELFRVVAIAEAGLPRAIVGVETRPGRRHALAIEVEVDRVAGVAARFGRRFEVESVNAGAREVDRDSRGGVAGYEQGLPSFGRCGHSPQRIDVEMAAVVGPVGSAIDAGVAGERPARTGRAGPRSAFTDRSALETSIGHGDIGNEAARIVRPVIRRTPRTPDVIVHRFRIADVPLPIAVVKVVVQELQSARRGILGVVVLVFQQHPDLVTHRVVAPDGAERVARPHGSQGGPAAEIAVRCPAIEVHDPPVGSVAVDGGLRGFNSQCGMRKRPVPHLIGPLDVHAQIRVQPRINRVVHRVIVRVDAIGPVLQQLRQPPHVIVRCIDGNGDVQILARLVGEHDLVFPNPMPIGP